MYKEIKLRLIFCITVSVLIILFEFFKWSFGALFTPFFYLPFYAVIRLCFLMGALFSITCLFKYKKIGINALSPLLVLIFAFMIIKFVPFTNLWLKAEFLIYKSKREDIVKKVYAGELVANVGYNTNLIALKNHWPLISKGGNEIITEEHNRQKYVLFFTYRGFLDNYSGFLYVPKKGDPKLFSDLGEPGTQIIKWHKNWYYVSHH